MKRASDCSRPQGREQILARSLGPARLAWNVDRLVMSRLGRDTYIVWRTVKACDKSVPAPGGCPLAPAGHASARIRQTSGVPTKECVVGDG